MIRLAFLTSARVLPNARWLLSLAIAALLAVPCATAVSAQGFSPFNFFQQMFQPTRPQYERDYRQQPRYRQARPRPKATTPRPPPVEKAEPKPTVPPSFFVAVLGDSLGQLLAQGMTDAMADHPDVAILHKARESSGLVRDDFYDWPKAVQELLASGQKIDVAVILVGSNDHQTLRENGVAYEAGTPQWNEIYAKRVEAIATLFHNAKIPLLWVGLPIMKNDRFSAQMASLNDIYRDHAARAGATFVDVWDAFGDENGRFSAYGPDVNGEAVRLRTSDGIYFTKAGARKLAQFVETEVQRIYDAKKPKDDAALAKIETTTPAGAIAPNAASPAVPVKPQPASRRRSKRPSSAGMPSRPNPAAPTTSPGHPTDRLPLIDRKSGDVSKQRLAISSSA
jgi:hypothetical protein